MNNQIEKLIDSYKDNIQRCNFLDSNCWLSRWEQAETFYQVACVDALAEELMRHSIPEAVVSSYECLQYDPVVGNKMLLESIKSKPNLYAGIVWVPEIAFTHTEVENYLINAIHSKAVVVRMFPKKLNHSMKNWQIGDTLRCMQRYRLPLMLWHTETSWDTINEICEEFSDLPVIIEGNDQKLLYHNRYYIPLLKKHRNLYLETHNLINYIGIDYLANSLNITQLIFGSYFPSCDPNASMMMIANAYIDEPTRIKIAGGNMRELIKNLTDRLF